MNPKTPTVGKQLSSSLRERLKKCGRYHASPKPGSPSVASTPDKRSPVINGSVSRKRLSSSSPIDTGQLCKRQQSEEGNMQEKAKFIRSGNEIESNFGQSIGVEDNLGNSTAKFENKPLSPVGSTCTTPLTSRQKFIKNTQVRSNRLKFQGYCDLKQSADTTSSTHGHLSVHCSDSSQNVLCSKSPSDTKDAEETFPESGIVKTENRQDSVVDEIKSSLVLNRCHMLKEISEKEEILRQLKMVKTYRTKNNLTELQALIDKWRRVSQEALQDLHCEMLEPKPTLTQLINHLAIDHKLVKYEAEEETFDE